MDAVGADPLYMKLCRAQKCFRARVSPEPWRCGFTSPSARFPFDDDTKRAQFEEWKREYDGHQKDYASAKLLEIIGSRFDSSLNGAIDLHDELCHANSDLALA